MTYADMAGLYARDVERTGPPYKRSVTSAGPRTNVAQLGPPTRREFPPHPGQLARILDILYDQRR